MRKYNLCFNLKKAKQIEEKIKIVFILRTENGTNRTLIRHSNKKSVVPIKESRPGKKTSP